MNPLAQAVTGALAQSVWQGIVVFAALRIALYLLRRRSPEARYVASCAALGLFAALPVFTAFDLYDPGVPDKAAATTLTIRGVWSGSAPLASRWLAASWITENQPWILRLWLMGVAILSARLAFSGARIASLRRSNGPADDRLVELAGALARRMGTKRAVRLLVSSLPTGPSLAGWIRPVILLPVSAIVNLTPDQLEAVLAHELAHLARYDDFVNIVQSAVETVLFYHPAVWWISARIRYERELCCDDRAVRICGDPVCYARALTALERLRVRAPRLALGTTDGPLGFRIRRIVNAGRQEYMPSGMCGMFALGLAVALVVAANGELRSPRKPAAYPAAALTNGIQGTVPVDVTADASGAVTRARARGGPPELRDAAVRSVAALHLSAGSQRINVAFQLAKPDVVNQPPEMATLEGQVLGAGGKPLAKATVRLNPTATPGRAQNMIAVTTVTDSNGHFVFEQAQPGRYNVRAEHLGYVSGLLAMVQPTPGQRMADLKIELIPMAVISGKVVDTDGDPMESVEVRSFVFRYSDGQRFESQLGVVRTDDRGEFRLTGVSPGRVRLSFAPPEHSSFGSIGEDPQPRSGARTNRGEDGYVATYYPGVPDADSALPISVAAGQDVAGLKITMRKVPVFHVRGKVTGAPAYSSRKIGDWEQGIGMPFAVIGKDGSFDLAGMRPGLHTLIVTSDGADMGMIAVVPVTVSTEDVETTIDIAPPGNLTGSVKLEGTPPPDFSLPSIKVTLNNTAWISYAKDGTTGADGSFTIENLRPRKYTMQIRGLPANGYLKSATLGGRGRMCSASILDLSGGVNGAPLEITVSTAGAKIAGVVTTEDGEQIAGTRLVLVPDTSGAGTSMALPELQCRHAGAIFHQRHRAWQVQPLRGGTTEFGRGIGPRMAAHPQRPRHPDQRRRE